MTPSSSFLELNKAAHNRKSFDCGTAKLNIFLQQFALRHRDAGISMTMVLPSAEHEAEICAYYTLSHTEIERQNLPQSLSKKLPLYPIPVILIAQLAVHKEAQGQGIGKITLIRALQHCYTINHHLPSYAVVVDVLHDGLQGFYAQYGFQMLDAYNHRARLFLPMKAVEELFF